MDIHELTATEIVRQVGSGELSPVEVVTAFLERIDATEPELHAWALVDRDGALAQARELERRLGAGEAPGLLAGLPVGVKDVFHVRGLPTVANFAPNRGQIAEYDAGVVERLRESGAVMLGKTETVQFAFSSEPPATRNPWQADRSPGGSSSGSGAAVAVRQVPAALSTETGGSTLRPAAYNGVVGVRPTFGSLSRHGLLPASWTFDHAGFIVRSVADAGLLLQALAAHDPRDPASVSRPAADFVSAAANGDARPPRLAIVRDLLDRAETPIRVATESALQRLAEEGAEISEVRLPVPMETLLAAHHLITSSESGVVHGERYRQHAEHFWPGLRDTIETGMLIPAAATIAAGRLLRQLRRRMASLLDEADALVAPTVSNLPPDRSTTGDARFQTIWTICGLPNISIPTGIGPEGLPRALQIVGRPFGESDQLAIAAWCERIFGRLSAPPL